MTINDIAKEYNLSKEPNVDFWLHKQSGQWILTHNAIEKIAASEQIKLIEWEVLNSELDFCRFKITMQMRDKLVTTIGEADKSNCMSKYYGAMAEKRGIDRCVLKLINAYQYGISSEVEADDFKKPDTHLSYLSSAIQHTQENMVYQKTENQKEKFDKLLSHTCFDGKKKDIKEFWLQANSLSATESVLTKMNQKIKEYKKENNKESL